MISFVIKNGGPQPVQCCFTLAVCSAIFSLDSSQISMNKLIFGKIWLSKKWFLLPYLSRFGRRTSFFSLLFMEVSVSIITCFSPTYTAFTVLRTLNGVTFPALFQIPFILCKSASDGPIFCCFSSPFLLGLETMGPAYRTFAGMMICLFFAVALMILAGVAYIFNSWQDLAYVSSFPFIALFR